MEQIRIAILNPYNKVLAFLDNTVPNAMHYFDEILHTYLKGSSYTFEFTTMTAHDDAVFLVEGNKLSFIRKNKGYHLTIMSVEKGGDTTSVTAYGLCLELTNEYVDAYKATKAMSFEEYINAYGFERSFTIGKNEVSNKKISHEWTGTDTVLARLYSIANVFDAELEFVTQLNDDYSLKNVVLNIYRAHSDSVQGMGSDKHSTILRYPNDIYGITKTSDITELYTAIRPTGTNGLQLNSISGRTVKDSNGNVLYKVNGNNILAPQSRDRFPSTLITNHSNDMYAVQIWSYETENVETLYGQALAQLKKNCVPKVTYDVDAYIDADIGDTFTIEDAEYSPTLYLEARITEQEICFTDTEKCKTIFDNFEEKQSQISSALISEMNKMIELKKVYEGSIVSSNGVLFKNDSDSTQLTALVKDDGVDITSKYSIVWLKDDVQLSTDQTITVSASDLSEKAVYRFKAMSGEILKASAEVTVMRLQDGQNGTSAYVHIAYANSSDGRVDFSLTDSNRKFIGQYSDSKQYGSDDPTKYRWSVIKGDDGKGIKSTSVTYQIWPNGTSTPTGTWSSTPPKTTADKPYLWTRTVITYSDNTQSTSYSVGSTPEGIVVGGRNLIKYGKGDSKNGIFKNFTHIKDGYAELTLKSKKTYASANIEDGFVLGCREYKVGAFYIWSYDIMYTEWNFPSGTNRTEFWFGQRYTNAPSGQTGTGLWTQVTGHSLPQVGANGCKLNEWYHVEQKIIVPVQASANVGTAASIQFYNSNANVEASFTARFKNVKLELGNKATDWTPAPEDVDNAINEERTTRQSAIETKANEITSKVSETYVSNSAFEHYQNTVSSQFTQTKKDFTWSINQSVTDAKNEMSGQIDSVNGRVDGLKQTTDNVNNYMSFDNDGLTLGKSDSAFKTKITNQEWSIQKNGAKVTYINDQTMYITDGQFTRSLKIGNFGFVPRANGSLDFKKIR